MSHGLTINWERSCCTYQLFGVNDVNILEIIIVANFNYTKERTSGTDLTVVAMAELLIT